MQYLVTTKIENLVGIENQIIMVDGTVPGWKPRHGDLHFDHHRPGGDPIQLTEIPDSIRINLDSELVFVTTQVDADACAAAAWLMLPSFGLKETVLESANLRLRAIAYDCDHLGLPPDFDQSFAEFARNAVAALKLAGNQIALDLGLPIERQNWTNTDHAKYKNTCFQVGVEWLIDASLGLTQWPGENGEAEEYWSQLEKLRPYVDLCAYLIDGFAVLDQRSLRQYCDPRLLVEWTRKQPSHKNITLTIRDRPLALDGGREIPGFAYTLGSVPLHKDGSPCFSDRQVWQALVIAERNKRIDYGYPLPTSDWGGRNEVGGSSWNDASVLTPKEVIWIAQL